MTEALYYSDPSAVSCEARVLRCEPATEGIFALELDRSVLFPGGSGCAAAVLRYPVIK